MLRHLPIDCDVLLVEVDLTTLVSPEILLPFQAELDKRASKRRDRAKRVQKEKKRDLDHMLAQTLHIEEIKALARTESERKLGMLRELINGPALTMSAGGDSVGDGGGGDGGGAGGEGGEETSMTSNNNPEGQSQESLDAEGPGLGLGLSEGESTKSSGTGGPPVLSFAKITQVNRGRDECHIDRISTFVYHIFAYHTYTYSPIYLHTCMQRWVVISHHCRGVVAVAIAPAVAAVDSVVRPRWLHHMQLLLASPSSRPRLRRPLLQVITLSIFLHSLNARAFFLPLMHFYHRHHHYYHHHITTTISPSLPYHHYHNYTITTTINTTIIPPPPNDHVTHQQRVSVINSSEKTPPHLHHPSHPL